MKHEPEEQILARVGDRTISVNEFIKRAEYTIRPNYVKLDYYINKKIILNSLIAEKLFALEEENQSQLMQNERFQAFIKGRMEQTMRNFMYQSEAKDKVHISDEELKQMYKLAGRKYKIHYFSVSDSSDVNEVTKKLNEKPLSFDNLYRELTGTSEVPQKEIAWDSKENTRIMEALFSGELKKDQVLSPVRLEDGHYLFIKINGWTDSQILNDEGIKQRLKDVREKLIRDKADLIWAQQVAAVMRGKEIVFYEDTFFKLVDLMGPQYYRTRDQMDEALNQKLWADKDYQLTIQSLGDPNIVNEPFFTIDGKIWTVKDFRDLLFSHPLVFRKKEFPQTEFADQFKLAVVDMVRDHYMNKEAYKNGYDKANIVQREKYLWQDAYVAKEHRLKYLKAKDEKRNFAKDYLSIMDDYMNDYVNHLQQKYANQIEIDTDLFDSIHLTRIDLHAKYINLPYASIIPDFPIYTSDHHLNYGRKMEK